MEVIDNMLKTELVLQEVAQERLRQCRRWGIERWKSSQWLAILGEEYGEVCRAVYEIELMPTLEGGERWKENYREELIQVAAVAVAMIECFDKSIKPNVMQYSES